MTAVTQAKGTELSPRDGRATVEASEDAAAVGGAATQGASPYTQARGWGWGGGGSSCGHQPGGRGTEGSEGAAGLWSVTLPAAVLQRVAGFTYFICFTFLFF